MQAADQIENVERRKLRPAETRATAELARAQKRASRSNMRASEELAQQFAEWTGRDLLEQNLFAGLSRN